MQADYALSHFSFDFRSGRQCRNGVYYDDIHSITSYQSFENVKRLLAAVRLADIQVFYVYAKFFGIYRVKCVFRVDKCSHTAACLTSRNRVQCYGSFTGRFGAVNFDYSALGQAAYSQCHIESKTSRTDNVYMFDFLIAESDNRAFAVLLFDFGNRVSDKFGFFIVDGLLFLFHFTPLKYRIL